MTSPDGRERWRRGNPGEILSVDFGDAVIIYHRPSGKTHLLNDASVALLSEILVLPKTLEEIEAAIDLECRYAKTPEFSRHTEALLRRLQEFGLIEQV